MIPTAFRFLTVALLAGSAAAQVPYTVTPCNEGFIEISAPNAQQRAGGVEPIGFPFTYFGQTYTEIQVSLNGYATFDLNASNWASPQDVPDPATPNNLVAPWWAFDLDLVGFVDLHTLQIGSAPNRMFIMQWDVLATQPGQGGEDQDEEHGYSFEAILHESGVIDFRYRSNEVPDTEVAAAGVAIGIGIENAVGEGIGLDEENIDFAPFFVGKGKEVSSSCWRFEPLVDDGEDLNCLEFDRYEDLTPNDTLTVLTNVHNPQQEEGYLYAYAVDASGDGIGFDHLVGHLLIIDGLETFEYSVNPIDYRAAVGAGEPTDVDNDRIRDLNGVEYEKTADELLVPRFIGAVPARSLYGELVLIALSGGTQFVTTVDFLIYNDNEQQFSANYKFRCWDKVRTTDVSLAFDAAWLENNTAHDENESLSGIEYGWFRMNGGVANSSAASILDPAVHGFYIEHAGPTSAADLPFEVCSQDGHLLPRSLTGDNEESAPAEGVEECEDVAGRKPASLLLFPEFNNRVGAASVVTVTNTSETDDVRVHFIYVGRYGN